jgi:hypothetical protein
MFGLTVVFFVPAVILAATQSLFEFKLSNLLFGLSFVAFGAVGAMVASHRPENIIGWFLSAGGVLVAAGLLCVEYAIRAYLAEGFMWPAGDTAAWLGLVLVLTGLTLLLPATALHFPNGQLPSSRWRWVRGLLATGAALCLALTAFAPGSLAVGRLSVVGETRNPFGLEIPLLEVLQPIVVPLFATVFVAAFAAPYLRLRRARGVERQQLKWFVYATVLMAASLVTAAIGGVVRPGQQAADVAINTMSAVGLMALPVAVGIAVMRYRLYEIDLVVNKTIVYVLLTAALVGSYVVLVLVFQRLFGLLVEDNDLAVAASTLAVAALFRPARGHIQGLVDRRFYRQRYDAHKTVEDFATHALHEVDVSVLTNDLTETIRRVLQPSHLSLWLSGRP